ncbi:MAG TPA: methylated-DNA--[protein]-cysteine S-methyltransferase [Streptosporangiaceae bacterium]|jgi:methylated-DNA-[protein]-cysteine S-methyltransferase
MALEWARLDTPVGPVSVGCGDAGVALVRFGEPPAAGGTRPQPGADGRQALARAACTQLAEYFGGRRQDFELPLDWSGFAPPQHRVLGLLHDRVGYGHTVTYGALAGLAGLAASRDVVPARAVGKIMGSNPIPVIVPCHRVVASDGLGGYSGGAGPEVKRWLLILEGAIPPTLDWVPASPADH